MRRVVGLLIAVILWSVIAHCKAVSFRAWNVEIAVKAKPSTSGVHAIIYLRRTADLPDREVAVFLRLMGQDAKGGLWVKDFKVYYGRYMQIPKNTWLKLEADIPLNATVGEWISGQLYVNDIPTKQWFKSDIARLVKIKASEPSEGLVKVYVSTTSNVVNPGSNFVAVVGIASGIGMILPLEEAWFKVYYLTPTKLLEKKYEFKAEALMPFYFNYTLKIPVPEDAVGPILYELHVDAYDPCGSFRPLRWMGKLAEVNITGLYNASLVGLAKAFNRLTEAHKGLLMRYEELSGKYSNAEAEAMALSKYVENLKAELEKAKGEANEYRDQLIKLQLQLVRSQAEAEKSMALVKILNSTVARWEERYNELKMKYKKELSQKDQKIRVLAEQVASLKSENEGLKRDKAKLESTITNLNNELNDLQNDLNELNSKLSEKERVIQLLEYALIGMAGAVVGLGVIAAKRRPIQRIPPEEVAREEEVEI